METTDKQPQTEERDEVETTVSARYRAIEATAGVLAGVYPPDYLEQLRRDWPD